MEITLEDALSLQGQALKARVEAYPDPQDLNGLYLQFRYLYLKGDHEGMKALLADKKDLIQQQAPWLAELLSLRLAIRTKSPLTRTPQEYLGSFNQISASAWQGEAFMILAMACEDRQDERTALVCYQKSAAAFLDSGFQRKSLIARYNALASQTRAQADKKYFFELQSFANEAVQMQCFDLAGTALANLSRECQLAGAIELALRHNEEALHYMKTHDFGSLQYFLATAHQLNLLLQLCRWSEAIVFYEELLLSPFLEVQEIKAAIDDYLNADKTKQAYAHLPFTWRERLNETWAQKQIVFTSREQQLIESLTEGPLSIDQLAVRVYGEKIAFESSVARTKQLLHRLKQKAPRLIGLENGRYGLL